MPLLTILAPGLGMGGRASASGSVRRGKGLLLLIPEAARAAGTTSATAFAAPGWTFANGPPARFVAFTPQPGGAAALLLLHF